MELLALFVDGLYVSLQSFAVAVSLLIHQIISLRLNNNNSHLVALTAVQFQFIDRVEPFLVLHK